jgi:hypothetical protein
MKQANFTPYSIFFVLMMRTLRRVLSPQDSLIITSTSTPSGRSISRDRVFLLALISRDLGKRLVPNPQSELDFTSRVFPELTLPFMKHVSIQDLRTNKENKEKWGYHRSAERRQDKLHSKLLLPAS